MTDAAAAGAVSDASEPLVAAEPTTPRGRKIRFGVRLRGTEGSPPRWNRCRRNAPHKLRQHDQAENPYILFGTEPVGANHDPGIEFAPDLPLEGAGFELVWGLLLFSGRFGLCCRLSVWSGKAVLRPVACDQVREARGRAQGTETVAKPGGLPPSGAAFRSALTPEHAERQ